MSTDLELESKEGVPKSRAVVCPNWRIRGSERIRILRLKGANHNQTPYPST